MGWIIIFGIITGIFCTAIAKEKGRNPHGWFWLGFLFSFIPVIIVAILPPIPKNMGQVQCPKCLGWIDERASVCMHCRTPTNPSKRPVYVVSQRNIKIALLLVLSPSVGLIFVIVIYFLMWLFVPHSLSINIVNYSLGIMFLICLIGILVSIPLNYIFLNKKELAEDSNYDELPEITNNAEDEAML